MNFASALFSLKRGFKIKRHDWIGYWELEGNEVMIHLKDGTVMNLVDSEDIVFTMENMACDDWEVITDANNVGLPKCPSNAITSYDGNKQWEDLKVGTNNTAFSNSTNGSYSSVNNNVIHTPTNNQPVNDNEIYEACADCAKQASKYDTEFCRFDGSKWVPTDIKTATHMQILLGDYRLCYRVGDEWIPWNAMNTIDK